MCTPKREEICLSAVSANKKLITLSKNTSSPLYFINSTTSCVERNLLIRMFDVQFHDSLEYDFWSIFTKIEEWALVHCCLIPWRIFSVQPMRSASSMQTSWIISERVFSKNSMDAAASSCFPSSKVRVNNKCMALLQSFRTYQSRFVDCSFQNYHSFQRCSSSIL